MSEKVKITVMVPAENADELRQALGAAGAGQLGEYSYCSFSVTGKGRFIPGAGANPHIGEANKPEVVEEERIEVICERPDAKQVVEAIKKAHPYEEPAYDIVALINEEDL